MNNEIENLLSNFNIEEYNIEKFGNKVTRFLGSGVDEIISSDELDFADEETFFILVKSEVEYLSIVNQLDELEVMNSKKIDKIYIFDISFKALKKVDVERKKNLRSKIQSVVMKRRADNEYISLRDIVYEPFFVADVPSETKISISVDSRIKSLEKELQVNPQLKLKGYVFSASLKDIVELYNELGSSLFNKNLRYDIVEQLGVNESIGKTIENDEENKFWFLNNGVSLFVNDIEQVDFSVFDKIRLTIGSDKKVSVINGAQTITASSKMDFKNKNPYVLFRLYVFSGEHEKDDTAARSTLDEITVALNRQKPIKSEDIAYTYDFVAAVNSLNMRENNKKYGFQFARRGEIESNIFHRYAIINFARLVKSYMSGKPGEARSQGANTLLKEGDKLKFKDEEIFVDLTFDEDQKSEDLFLKKYKPVNFAFKLKALLSDSFLESIKGEMTDIENKEERLDALIKYGRYFLIAYYIRDINNKDSKDSSDFSNWKYTDIQKNVNGTDNTILNEKSVLLAMVGIFNKFSHFIDNNVEYNEIDANTFKKNKIFIDFCEFEKE